MEGQQHMPGGEPPEVKAPRKPKLAVEGSQSQGVRKSKQPEVANWDGYAAADPNQGYAYGEDGYGGQGYDYGDGTHGYGYGDGTPGWDPNQGYGYDDGTQGYGNTPGYGYGDGYGNGAPGYEAPPAAEAKAKKPKKPKKPAADGSYENQQAVQGGSYGNQPQVDEYGQPTPNGYGAPGNEAPPAAKEKTKKPKKPKTPAAEGSHENQQLVQGGSFEHRPQVDEYGQPLQDACGAPGYEAPPAVKEKTKKPKKPKTPAAEGSYENQQPVQGRSYENQPQVDEYGQPLQDACGAPGYEAPPAAKEKTKKPKKPKAPAAEGSYENQQPVQGGSYESQPQVDEYGQPLQDACGAPGYEAPPAAKEKSKKPKKPKTPAAEGSYGNQQLVQGGCYEDQPQVDEYGQSLQNGYGAPDSTKPHKSRKSSRDKSLERANHSDGAYVVPSNVAYGGPGSVPSSRALSRVHGEHDNDLGSARSRSSQEGSQGAVPARARSSDREGSGSSRARAHREDEMRSSREGSGTRHHPSSSRRPVENGGKPAPNPNSNALNEHVRKSSGTARSALDEFMKQQPRGQNVDQQVSMIVQPDDNKDALETQIFGKRLSIMLPPVETTQRPQFQAVAEKPLYQPVQRRPTHAITRHQEVQAEQNLPIVVKQNEPNAIHEPNAKCMACVHGVGVPITRMLTRIACKQCQNASACIGCTIL